MDLNVNARMRTEIDLNECEHFLKENWDRSESIDSNWILKAIPTWVDLRLV